MKAYFSKEVVGILLLGWTLFFTGWLLQSKNILLSIFIIVSLFSPYLLLTYVHFFLLRNKTKFLLKKKFTLFSAIFDEKRFSNGVWILLATALSLFLELAIIRIHSSYFQLFAYFKNISLLSCFLGLSIGYAIGAKKPLPLGLVIPAISFQILFMHAIRYLAGSFFLQNPISEQFTIGLVQTEALVQTITVYGFLIFIFAFNTICFIPIGQLISRLMLNQNKLTAYSWNLAGSITGVLIFALLSFFWTPPPVWILIVVLGIFIFIYKDAMSLLLTGVFSVLLLVGMVLPYRSDKVSIYSPYQVLSVNFEKNSPPIVKVNNVYFQKIIDFSKTNKVNNFEIRESEAYYSLPYRFKPAPKKVLIVGSGTGNDVAAAVRYGARAIDAVEIDPAIVELGKQLHPENPYQEKNVTTYVNDARAHIKHTEQKYDLIVYGLLDSHTLLANMSGGIRLDSYIYTEEAFYEARKVLNKDGVISMTFSLLNQQLGRKLFLMLQHAFNGKEPIVYRSGYDGGYTFLIGESISIAPLKDLKGERLVTKEFANSSLKVDVSTDDWPFFYMPVRQYPFSYVIIIVFLVVISLAFLRRFLPDSQRNFSFPFFFLGAGFMLIETKAITELALVYGSTWVVTSIVITVILIMGLIANLIISKFYNISEKLLYFLLGLSLALGIFIPLQVTQHLSKLQEQLFFTLIIIIPALFSGGIFSLQLKRVKSIGSALFSNLLGAMIGGFLEYNAMFFGFHALYFVGFALYSLAFLSSWKKSKK